jgi:transposase InsO family protein
MQVKQESIEEIVTRVTDLVDEDTAKIIDFMYAENRTWRELHGDKRPRLNDHQRRRLARAGGALDKDLLGKFATLVQPETILKWYRRLKKNKWDYSHRKKGNVGRPRVSEDTETLVLRLADETTWGAKHIADELRKLGHLVDDNTVRRILERHGYPTGPERGGISWKDFIKAHMDVIWAADMFTEEIVTAGGLVTFYVLFFIHLATRRVHIAGCTPSPDAEWMKQQARNFLWLVRTPAQDDLGDASLPLCRFVIHDRDSSLLPLDDILRSEDIEPKRTPVRAPKANAFAERFVREARETLDNFIIFGERRMHRVLTIIERHHNECRPHQGLDGCIPLGYDYPSEPAKPEEVRCKSELGGLLKHYYVEKKAA